VPSRSARLLRVHRQLVDPDLHHAALRAQQSDRQPRRRAGAERQLRTGGKLQGDLGHRVEALHVREHLHMVEDQGDRLGHGRQRGGEPGQDAGRDGDARRGEGLEDLRAERLDPVKRRGDVGQQDRGVVVAPVDRDPSGAAALALGPLGQQDRLAVP
jgi:hypothetical protein